MQVRSTPFVTYTQCDPIEGQHQRPDRLVQLESVDPQRQRIPRGGGYSYVPASFGSNTLSQEMVRFDRFLAFDKQKGTVTVEAGMPLEKLFHWSISKRLYLKVQPGYPGITIGGCIAGDVHGKNPAKDGTFRQCVRALTLCLADGQTVCTSPEENAELFNATCGGLGLTGLIIDATLQLSPVISDRVEIQPVVVRTALESLALLQSAQEVDFAYAWHDASHHRKPWGRGVFYRGSWCRKGEELPIPSKSEEFFQPLTAQQRCRLPFALWNQWSASVINGLYYTLQTRHLDLRITSLYAALFPFVANPWYHRLYGRPGFTEIQLLVPWNKAESFLTALERLVQSTSAPIMLMAMKGFEAPASYLRFAESGIAVTLDLIPSSSNGLFFERLDALALEHLALPNILKDNRLSMEMVQKAYPGYAPFRQVIHHIDPTRRFQSALSQRLGL
ncbi:FAD linked oxidase domain protein [Magnetococcus marinus MC-1]|uniref:FAD linked oxidase domain protein n=1 Tax=Magnetococcus marinus (strain ATCC BAA-1437 / JCM 17883 / MC-1) TaxID=156889 RepID=A0L6R1_MAGMM|nr:FAD-binding oxidoreductase [Magnetococcus marinus]ABK43654.1 FAD linked oxidase domain protein [Magnetococcus marinus MC-1]